MCDNFIDKEIRDYGRIIKGHGVLDSITMVTLVLQLSDEFDVDISPVDITPENFKTVQTIYDMIQRLEDE